MSNCQEKKENVPPGLDCLYFILKQRVQNYSFIQAFYNLMISVLRHDILCCFKKSLFTVVKWYKYEFTF